MHSASGFARCFALAAVALIAPAITVIRRGKLRPILPHEHSRASGLDAYSNVIGRFATATLLHLVGRNRRNIDLNIDAIEQRPEDFCSYLAI